MTLAVATIRIAGSTDRMVGDGDYGFTYIERICIEPVNIKAGLARNVTVEVTLRAETAKGMLNFMDYCIIIILSIIHS